MTAGYHRTGGFYGRYRATDRFARNGGRQAELKFHDLDVDDATVAAGATIAQDSCNKIAQGVTEITRVGRKCTIRMINWRFNIFMNAAATTNTGDVVRVILFLDKQCNGATAVTTDIVATVPKN